MLDKISWLGHSSVRISGEKIVYIDPWKLKNGEKADIILVSHSHYDHMSPEDIRKICREDTVIITTPDCSSELSGDVRSVRPGDKITVFSGITVEAVPAYNINKDFHPKANGWVGFVVSMNGKRIYYCGDTDFIPEMRNVMADIVIAPVGGTYTMSAEEAAEAVNLIKPEAAIPIHYGDIVGSVEDAKRFKNLCNVTVEIKSVVNP